MRLAHNVKDPSSSCESFDCIIEIEKVDVPIPKSGEVLIRVEGSSINPTNVGTIYNGSCIEGGCGTVPMSPMLLSPILIVFVLR